MLLQRVSSASVTVDGRITGAIGRGIVLFLGVGLEDTEEHATYLVDKLLNLRIFEDAAGKMNLTLLDVSGGLLIVSQFTLYADLSRGRRPSFEQAAPPQIARELYNYFVDFAKCKLANVQTGVFQAEMTVSVVNQGPVSIYYDTVDKFRNKSHAVR